MSTTTIVALFVIGALASIAFHELGHFVPARAFRMAVSDFSVGFGKPLVTLRRNGIAYRLRLLPLGGFVKIHGMRPGEAMPAEPNGEAFVARPAWQRFVVAVAGPSANVVLAWVLLALAGLALPLQQVSTQIAADTGGLQAGDRVVVVAGTEVGSAQALGAHLEQASGPLAVDVARGGDVRSVRVASVEELGGALGVETTRMPLAAAAGGASALLRLLTYEQFVGLGTALTPSNAVDDLRGGFAGEQRSGEGGLMSIVGLGHVVAQQGGAESDGIPALVWLLFLLAALNLALALVNLLPVTPLDGGHAALAVIEGSVSWVRAAFGGEGAFFLPRLLVSGVTVGSIAVLLTLGTTLVALDVVNPLSLQG